MRATEAQESARQSDRQTRQASSRASRLWRGRRPPHELVKRQIRHDTAGGCRIHDNLVSPPEQPLHGLEIHALTRNIWRLLVLVVDLAKAGGRTLGLGHGLLAIGFRALSDLR